MGHKGKYMMCTLYVLQYAKSTCQAETKPNSEKIKLMASEFVKLKASVSQSVSRKIHSIKNEIL